MNLNPEITAISPTQLEPQPGPAVSPAMADQDSSAVQTESTVTGSRTNEAALEQAKTALLPTGASAEPTELTSFSSAVDYLEKSIGDADQQTIADGSVIKEEVFDRVVNSSTGQATDG